jgi:hypothetical protein
VARAPAIGGRRSDSDDSSDEAEEEEEEDDDGDDGDDDESAWPEYSKAFVDLVLSLMHPTPEMRPSTAEVLQSDLLASGVESKLRQERAYNKMLATQLKSQLLGLTPALFFSSAGGMGGIGAGTKRKISEGFPTRAPLRRSMTS